MSHAHSTRSLQPAASRSGAKGAGSKESTVHTPYLVAPIPSLSLPGTCHICRPSPKWAKNTPQLVVGLCTRATPGSSYRDDAHIPVLGFEGLETWTPSPGHCQWSRCSQSAGRGLGYKSRGIPVSALVFVSDYIQPSHHLVPATSTSAPDTLYSHFSQLRLALTPSNKLLPPLSSSLPPALSALLHNTATSTPYYTVD